MFATEIVVRHMAHVTLETFMTKLVRTRRPGINCFWPSVDFLQTIDLFGQRNSQKLNEWITAAGDISSSL